jgi:hypothetical protein
MPRLPLALDPNFDVSRVRSQSVAAWVNCYAEQIKGKSQFVLQGYPGLVRYGRLTGPIRGALLIPANSDVGRYTEKFYVVAGGFLYSVAPDGVGTVLGAVPGSDLVEMDNNRYQVGIVSETKLYVWDTQTDVFTEVTDPDFTGASSIATVNGIGLLPSPKGDAFAITAIDDYTSFTSLDRATAESKADPLICIRVVNNEPWMMGLNGFEVWPNTGQADFPFERSAVNPDVGCLARGSALLFDNTLFWMGVGTGGGIYVYRAAGYEAQRISNHAVERMLQAAKRPDLAYAYIWAIDGHSFYTLVLDSGSVTYDATNGIWHQSTTGVTELAGAFPPVRFTCQAFVDGFNILGDPFGNLCKMTFDTNADLGAEYVREFITPPIGAAQSQSNLMRVQLELDTGAGSLTQAGECLMGICQDGGRVWEGWFGESMGLQGDYYMNQINWGPQGQADSHMLRFRVTDNVPFRVTGGWVDIIPNKAP